jgi:mannose-6-phosphate isomerase-like protein (cupin superfamily)
MPKDYQAVNFQQKFSLFTDQWQPRVVAELNDYQFKLTKVEGEFIWHTHSDTDEAFVVIDGELDIEFRGGKVSLSAGEMYVVPKGVEHKPVANKEAQTLVIEPRAVLNTGDQRGERTAENDIWV